MKQFIEDIGIEINDQELQNGFRSHYISILETIIRTGTYTPPRRLHPLKRILFCQNENADYIIYANCRANLFRLNRETCVDICNEYIAAFDECATSKPHKAVIIRKYLIELLSFYVQSCESVTKLEPQRSIVQRLSQ